MWDISKHCESLLFLCRNRSLGLRRELIIHRVPHTWTAADIVPDNDDLCGLHHLHRCGLLIRKYGAAWRGHWRSFLHKQFPLIRSVLKWVCNGPTLLINVRELSKNFPLTIFRINVTLPQQERIDGEINESVMEEGCFECHLQNHLRLRGQSREKV